MSQKSYCDICPDHLIEHEKEPTMSTRLYYDQYGIPTDISELEAWSE